MWKHKRQGVWCKALVGGPGGPEAPRAKTDFSQNRGPFGCILRGILALH